MVRSLAQVGITCSNIEASLRFYHDLLGIPLLEAFDVPEEVVRDVHKLDDGTKSTLFLLRTGNGGFLELFSFRPLGGEYQRVAWNRPGITHFALDVKHLPRVIEKLQAEGVEFVCAVQRNRETEFVFVRDPDGNVVELIDMKSHYWLTRLFGGLAAIVRQRTKYRDLYERIRKGGPFPNR